MALTARLWDVSLPDGSIFDIACAWLPDTDPAGVSGLDVVIDEPICTGEEPPPWWIGLPGNAPP